MSEWISFQEKLPEQYQHVLIYLPNYMSGKGIIVTSHFLGVDSIMGATHWMPLPSPPEKDERMD